MHWILVPTTPSIDRGNRPRQDRLRGPRNVLEEDVAVAGERGQDEANLLPLALHDRLDVRKQPVGDIDRNREV